MTLVFLFGIMVLAALLIAAIWWKPSKKSFAVASLPAFSSPFPSGSPEPSKQNERDQVLDEEIEMIAQLIRQDEFDRRRKSAMERLESLKVPK
jgi:hypothetical protein